MSFIAIVAYARYLRYRIQPLRGALQGSDLNTSKEALYKSVRGEYFSFDPSIHRAARGT
jgi:hypothetical protein